MELLANVMIVILMLVLGYMLFISVSTLVEAVVGVFMGYTIEAVSFLGFAVVRMNGKYEFTMVPINIVLEINMLHQEPSGEKRVKKGIITSVLLTLTVGVCGAIMFLEGWFSIFTISLMISIVLCLLLQWKVTIDWAKNQYGNGPEKIFWERDNYFSGKMSIGVRPSDIIVNDIPVMQYKELFQKNLLAQRCCLFDYFRHLDAGNYDKLRDYVKLFEELIGEIYNVDLHKIPYIYEIIYYYSMIEPNVLQAEHYYQKISEHLENDEDSNGCRVLAGYLYGTGKGKEGALKEIQRGLMNLDKFKPQGQAKMERDLLWRLREEIQQSNKLSFM